MNAGVLTPQYEDLTIEQRIGNLRKIVKYDIPEPKEYYFRDGIRKIHYIIVLQDMEVYKKSFLDRILSFLYFLEFQGLQLEFEMGLKDTDLVYIKVHASEAVIKHYANLYDIDIDDDGHNYIADTDWRYEFRQTELTKDDKDVFRRKGKPTSSEIIILIYKILSDPLTLEEKEVYGIDKMMKLGYIKDAYPLHDGPWQLETMDEKLWNDRQKLSHYWGNFSMWYKETPINLLETYYGTYIAFYFAWCEFYLIMLFIISKIGLLSLVFNYFLYLLTDPMYLRQVCGTTDEIICPLCDTDGCHMTHLSSYCNTSIMEYILGNTMQYAIAIAIWVAVFYICWKRRECTLNVRWNVHETDVEYKIRYDYKEKSSYFRKSKVTGKIEPYVPVGTRMYRYGFTYIVLGLLVSLVVGYVLLLSFLKSYVAWILHEVPEPKKTLLLSFVYGVFQAVFIKMCSLFYVGLAVSLTNIEVPKTESEYENSVIYKMYLFGFLNNYIPILYTALIRDNLLLLPGSSLIANLDDNNCLPTGCVLTLAIQLVTVTLLKYLGEFFVQLLLMKISRYEPDTRLPTWEREYYLFKTMKKLIVSEFSEMMIQFGYVSFFMSVCPPLASIVFFINIFKNRLNAVRLIQQFRRPVPKRSKGVGAWNDIMLFSSYFGVVCNAFVVGFNTRLILYIVHQAYIGVNKSFFDFVFSKYQVIDLPQSVHRINATDCIFQGQRYSALHKFKYRKRNDHFAVQSMKFAFIIIFENLVLVIMGILYYFVSAMPRRVKEQLRRDKMIIKNIKMKIFEKKLQSRLTRDSSLGQDRY